MGAQGFEDKVLRSAPRELTSKALEEAIHHYVQEGLTQDRNVRGCMLLAYRIQFLILSAVSSTDGSTQRRGPLTPGILVESNRLAAAIKPAVEAVRKTIFGNTRPPFAPYEAAVTWLEHMAKEPLVFSPVERERSERPEREIQEKMSEWNRLTGWSSRWTRSLGEIPYAKPGEEWLRYIPVPQRSPLASLEQASQEMAHATGFSQFSTIAYILVDIPPVLPPVNISYCPNLNETFGIFRMQAIIEVNSPDVPYDQRRDIWRKIRQPWNLDQTKVLTDRDRQLIEIVKSLGDPPKEHPAAYWRKAREIWNALEGEKATPEFHNEWRVTRRRYVRLREKLQELGMDLAASEAWVRAVQRVSKEAPRKAD